MDYKTHNNRCHFADTEANAPVAGEGNVEITNGLGNTVQLKNVLHVPSFPPGGQMQVTDGAGTVLVRGTLRRGLFHAICTVCQSLCYCILHLDTILTELSHSFT
jgi:hypothetical protein